MNKKTFLILAVSATMLTACEQTNNDIIPVNLRTEYLVNPIGLDTENPRFTWEYAGKDTTFIPGHYEIFIGTSPDNLSLYDENKELEPETRYYWQVKVWDSNNKICRISETASFELGKGENAEWKAKWITDDKVRNTNQLQCSVKVSLLISLLNLHDFMFQLPVIMRCLLMASVLVRTSLIRDIHILISGIYM